MPCVLSVLWLNIYSIEQKTDLCVLCLFALFWPLWLVLFILVVCLVFVLVIDLDSDRPGPAESHFGHSGISWPRRSRLYTQWKGEFSPSGHMMKSLIRNIPWIYTNDVTFCSEILYEFIPMMFVFLSDDLIQDLYILLCGWNS